MRRIIELIVVGLVVGLILKALDEYGGINMLKSIFQTFIVELWPMWGGVLAACIYWFVRDYLKLRHLKNNGKNKNIDTLAKDIKDIKKWIGYFSYKNNYSDLKGKIYHYIRKELKKFPQN